MSISIFASALYIPALISISGITTVIGPSISSCLVPALITGASASYSYYSHKNSPSNEKYIKSFIAMQTQLHQIHSGAKILMDAASVVKYYYYNEELNLSKNIDCYNLLKFSSFLAIGINPINSLKNIAFASLQLKVEEFISNKLPFTGGILNSLLPNFDNSIKTYDILLKSLTDTYRNIFPEKWYIVETNSLLSEGWESIERDELRNISESWEVIDTIFRTFENWAVIDLLVGNLEE